jgi:hypothetical protein
MRIFTALIVTLAAGSASALAATARVDGLGAELKLRPSASSMFAGDRSALDIQDARAIRGALNSFGIETEARATALLIDAGDGPMWTFLFEGVEGASDAEAIRTSLTNPGGEFSVAADAGAGLAIASLPAGVFEGEFSWSFGDALDVAGMGPGVLGEMGVDSLATASRQILPSGLFQFVTWDPARQGWSVAGAQHISGEHPEFNYRVVAVPTPLAATMAAGGLGGLALVRRRRR